VWDLETQCCVQTVVGHRCEIWSVAVLQRQQADGTLRTLLVTGASDELLRGYRLCAEGRAPESTDTTPAGEEGNQVLLEPHGTLLRQQSGGGGYDKCVLLEFNAAGNLLAAQTSGKIIEVSWVIVSL
jgi:U3 small nucleolar RNA-associated protein 12